MHKNSSNLFPNSGSGTKSYSTDYLRNPHWMLNLYGNSFLLNRQDEAFSLEIQSSSLTPFEVVNNVKRFLIDLDSINGRGYMDLNWLESSDYCIKKIEAT